MFQAGGGSLWIAIGPPAWCKCLSPWAMPSAPASLSPFVVDTLSADVGLRRVTVAQDNASFMAAAKHHFHRTKGTAAQCLFSFPYSQNQVMSGSSLVTGGIMMQKGLCCHAFSAAKALTSIARFCRVHRSYRDDHLYTATNFQLCMTYTVSSKHLMPSYALPPPKECSHVLHASRPMTWLGQYCS